MGPAAAPAVPPPQPPPSARRPKVAGGKWGGAQGEEGAPAGSTGPTSALTSPPTPTFLKQMSPIDELKVRSSLPPPTRPPTAEGGRKRGQGEWGGNQARLTLRPAGSLSYPSKAAAWGPRPGTRRLASGGPARQPFLPPPPLGRRMGRPAPTGPRGLGLIQLARVGAGAGSWGLPGRSDPSTSGVLMSMP